MSIETVFIPCAGKGTRMGEVGKKLAKPLWPLFEVTLLDFQIQYFKRLGFKNFIINSHHLAEQFESCNESISILYEPDLLGSGGSLHNLKLKYPDLKKILISNPDIIFNLSREDWMEFLETASSENNDNTLLGLECYPFEIYNELVVDDRGAFLRVEKYSDRNYLTYSGIGVVDLSSFPTIEGESSFFDTVVNSSINKSTVVKLGNKSQYWDFGTLDLYKDNLLKLVNETDRPLRVLLEEMGIFKKGKNYYKDNCINLGRIKLNLNRDGAVKDVSLIE